MFLYKSGVSFIRKRYKFRTDKICCISYNGTRYSLPLLRFTCKRFYEKMVYLAAP